MDLHSPPAHRLKPRSGHGKIRKKSLLALAALGLSGAAWSQSSVTLYGIADAGLGRMASDAKSGGDANNKTQFTSASLVNNLDSRVGLLGSEDLGGGLKAGFNFESGLDLDDGSATSSKFWARQAHLWISDDWGTLKLGRQFTVSSQLTKAYELTGTANYSVLANTYNYASLGRRADSAISYTSPTFSDFTVAASYVSKNDYLLRNVWDTSLLYASGPVIAGFSANKVSGGKLGYQLGGRYSFSNVTLAASYTQSVNIAAGSAVAAGVDPLKASRRGFGLGGTVRFGALSTTLDLTRDTKNQWDTSLKKYTNALLELRYALSKRTFLYGAYLRLDGTNNYGIGLQHNF